MLLLAVFFAMTKFSSRSSSGTFGRNPHIRHNNSNNISAFHASRSQSSIASSVAPVPSTDSRPLTASPSQHTPVFVTPTPNQSSVFHASEGAVSASFVTPTPNQSSVFHASEGSVSASFVIPTRLLSSPHLRERVFPLLLRIHVSSLMMNLIFPS